MKLANDIKYAFRMLGKSPGFTAVAVIALALGIGANTAIFSVVNAVLLRSLPYKDPSGIVMIWSDNPAIKLGVTELPSSSADLVDWKRETQVFEHVAMFDQRFINLTGDFEPLRASGAEVTGGFFEVFGVQPRLGRWLVDTEQEKGKDRVAVLSHSLWQARFAGDAGIVGKKILLDNVAYEVVGVMPPEFTYPRAAELPKPYGFGPECEIWVPRSFSAEELKLRNNRSYPGVARLRQGVSVERAHARLHALGIRVQEQNPAWKGWGFKVISFRDNLVRHVEKLILLMSLAVGFVLLIACANVANLLLSRASGRSREMAIRTALGAGRGAIIRQLLVESILLSLIAALAGIALASWGTDTLIKLSPGDIPRLAETRLDWRVLSFTLTLSIGTGVLFGLIPALHVSRINLSGGLKEGSRGTSSGRGRQRTRNLLTAGEVALAVVLLVAAGLLIRSFVQLQSVDPGFKAQSVLAFDVVLPHSKYGKTAQFNAFYTDLLARIRNLPGVQSAGAISNVPLSGTENLDVFITEGMGDPGRGREPFCDQRRVTPDYFRAAGVPIVAGRDFDSNDREGGQKVVIVNETLVRQFFPAGQALGKRLRFGRYNEKEPEWYVIVGIVKDVKQSALRADARPQTYRTPTQSGSRNMSIVLRGSVNPMSYVPHIRRAVAEIDPQQPVGNVRTLEQVISDSVSRERFTMTLITIFAGVATLLAVIGLYGVLAYGVSQRTQELGVRMALGAERRDVLRLVIGQGMSYVCIGLAIGLVCSLLLGRVLSTMLYGVTAYDAGTYAAVAVVLLIVAFTAAYVPARRATQVDPMTALRYE